MSCARLLAGVVFHATEDKMHRELTMLYKLPSPCRAELLEYLVQQTPEQTEEGREGGREGGRGRERVYNGSMIATTNRVVLALYFMPL